MGCTTYSSAIRSSSGRTEYYAKASVNEIFEQNKLRRIHDLMSPGGLKVRECRDSEAHPNTIAIIMGLDVTGSMGHIPHEFIKEGLPKMMDTMIGGGVKDAALMFLAIGDHECDSHPLQVSQFESGDQELDGWLTKTYIESGGGGNAGESYLLAWLVGARHTSIDCFEKRGKKGFIFTIGDEPCLNDIPQKWVDENIGPGNQGPFTAKSLLDEAKEKYNVYHLNVMQGQRGVSSSAGWKKLLGENSVDVSDYREIPRIIAKIVTTARNVSSTDKTDPEQEILA